MASNTESEDYGTTLALLWPETAPAPGEQADRNLDNERFLIAERRAKAASLYHAKKSMREISAQLKVSLQTVHADIHAVLDGWKRFARQNMAELIVRELARLAHREMDIEIEWERSKTSYSEDSAQAGTRGQNQFGQTSRKTRQRFGDPRLAALLLKCAEMRYRLLGILKPEDISARGDSLPPVKLIAGTNPVEMV